MVPRTKVLLGNPCVAKAAGTVLARFISRDIGQPTAYSHPELLRPDELFPGMKKSEFSERRTKLMRALSTTPSGMANQHHLVIIPAAEIRYMSCDVPHRFHQNNDFLYFTGFQEPDAVLLMECSPSRSLPDHKAVLYLSERNPTMEMWHGPRLGPTDAVDLLGIDEAYSTADLAHHLKSYSRDGYSIWYYGDNQIPSTVSDELNLVIAEILTNSIGAKIAGVNSILQHIQTLRLTKSSSELALMRTAGKITAQAFKKAMQATHPDRNELEIESVLEHECKCNGGQGLSFVPVVAGGARACMLHYITNNQRLKDGELVLVDAGCQYHGYISDVTRVWPVGGSFSCAQQDLYEAVLRVKQECTRACTPGATLNSLWSKSIDVLSEQLKVLGLIPNRMHGTELTSVMRKLYPHSLGHYVGMDVHDCSLINLNVPLAPGMTITIEPGVYIPRNFPINDPVKAKAFQGIGIRLEDTVAVTPTGVEVLNSGCPDSIEDIISLMKH